MKLLIPIAWLLAASAARSAITITVTPDAGGTSFRVTQDSENPLFTLDAVTTGFIQWIPLSAASFTQNPAVAGFMENFAAAMGTLTEVNGAGSAAVMDFRFFLDPVDLVYLPVLALAAAIYLPPNDVYQFSYADQSAARVSLDFNHFIPGTYVETNPLFGVVTTVVVPEPGALLLLPMAALFAWRRQRA